MTLFFLVLREKKCQPRILCPVEILFRKEAQIFLDKGKLREFVASKHTPNEYLKEIF